MRFCYVLIVFVLSALFTPPSAWGQIADRIDLSAPSPSAAAFFGSDVSLSADGSRALVGATEGAACFGSPSSTACGAGYVFVRSGGSWTLEATLTLPEIGINSFGQSVALSPDGTIALVGAPLAPGCPVPIAPNECGAVYAYARTGTTWAFEAKLIDPFFRTEFDHFGFDLALSQDGSTALIGAPGDDCIAAFIICGAAYVFKRSGGVWTLDGRLLSSPVQTEQIGAAVALSLDGNTALVGSAVKSKAYVYTRSGGVWTQQTVLLGSDSTVSDAFGGAVALSGNGDIALIGAPMADCPAGQDCGAAYAFARSGGIWTEQRKLTAAGAAPNDLFGSRVALSSDASRALILAGLEDCPAGADCGVVYQASQSGGTWLGPVELLAFIPGGPTFPPESLALSGDGQTGIVGVPQAPCPAGASCGIAAVFTLAFASAVPGIPTVSGLGLLLLALLLAASGARMLSRRRS